MLGLDKKCLDIANRLGEGDIWEGIRKALVGCENLGVTFVPRDMSDGRTTASRKFAKDNPEYIIDRESARALGFTLYRTGLACRRGHTGWRYVSTGNCVECHDPK